MRRFRLVCRASLGPVVCAALSACYSYTTLPPGTTPVGERVRVRVSGAEAERLEPVLGLTDREIEGELLEQADSTVSLEVPLPMPLQGGGTLAERAHQRIIIPRTDLQEIQLRRLDRTRTTLLVGAGVAGVAAIVAASTGTIQIGSGGSRGNPNEMRAGPLVPLLKWVIP